MLGFASRFPWCAIIYVGLKIDECVANRKLQAWNVVVAVVVDGSAKESMLAPSLPAYLQLNIARTYFFGQCFCGLLCVVCVLSSAKQRASSVHCSNDDKSKTPVERRQENSSSLRWCALFSANWEHIAHTAHTFLSVHSFDLLWPPVTLWQLIRWRKKCCFQLWLT